MLASLSFQDFTGQKLKKVIVTLEDVEKKLLEFILLFGVKLDGGENEVKKEEMIKRLTDESHSLDLKQDVVDEIFQDLGL
jgi:chemotaxis regulatin CheY-phosphate phosphatase CheZ